MRGGKMRLFLAGILFIQFSVGNLALAADRSLINQLPNPGDKCAWWNTTNTASCTDQTSLVNSNPWEIGDDDPTWNYNGPDNGQWGGIDPNSPFSNGNWGGGTYTAPKLTFLEQQMWSAITANYTNEVVDDMQEYGIWDSDTEDTVADQVISKYSKYATAWAIGATAGEALLDFVFLDKWRASGAVVGPAISSLGLSGLALMTESFQVMQMQITMLLEIMEVYGELPTNPTERANEASLAMTSGLVGPGLNLVISRALRIAAGAGAPPVSVLPVPGVGGGGLVPPIPMPNFGPSTGSVVDAVGSATADTLMGKTGIANAAEVEKVVPAIMEKTGFLKAAIARFGATKVGAFMAAHSALFKIGASTAFAALTTYGITRAMGNHYKKYYRKLAKLHEHNVLESFKNNSDAKQAVWLILTKNAFRPDKADDALTAQDAKLYATIVSQQIPLLHNGKYSESETLFKQYKAGGEDPDKLKLTPKPEGTPGVKPSPSPTPNIFAGFGDPSPKDTPKPSNTIDIKLARLQRDLDLQQKLYFIKIIESGMLMKGFLSSRDNDTLENISIQLGVNPPPKLVLKDNDPRALVEARYKALRDGLVGEVRKRVLAFAQAQGMSSQEAAVLGTNLPPGDLRYRAGEIMMEDFYSPEQQLISKWAARSNLTGVIDQKDLDKFKDIAPYLEGEKKLSKDITLPPNITADGSPRSIQAPVKK
jgi:hypothetical protein